MFDEKAITRFFHSRACAPVMMVVALILGWIAFAEGDVAQIGGPLGIGLRPAREWTGSPVSSLFASLTCTIAMGVLMLYISRVFNVMRSMTTLGVGLFFIMQSSLPSVMDRFYGGDLAGVMLLMCVVLLFGTFGEAASQRSVYLIFFLLTLATFTDLSFAVYLPVFLLGTIQMRIFSLRSFLAAGMGVLTPPWILIGFGIIHPSELHFPGFNMAWEMFKNPAVVQALVVSGFTLLTGLGFLVPNLLKIIRYNSKIRAYNGFLTLLMIATGVFILLNFNNFPFYIPILNCLTAYQIAHFFTYERTLRSYIPILLICASYLSFFVWALAK